MFRLPRPLAAARVMAIVAALSTPLSAQSVTAPPAGAQPPRDRAPGSTKGTAVVRGRVVAADTGRPLRRVRVTLTAEGGGADARRVTNTGLDGRYVFTELPAGRFRLSVSRSGYLALDHGQRRPGEQGRPLQLSDAETLQLAEFRLPRMAVITGRVTDENGEPVEGVSVMATRSMFFEGQRRLVPVAMTETDDAGEYRVTRLMPGTYFVRASTRETWTVVDAGKQTEYGYLPTYYPGVAAASEARAVKVALGQSVSSIDLGLLPGRTARVSGTALDSEGRPFARVSLDEEVRGVNFASFRGGLSGPVAADGTFSIANVPPGTYTLQASRMPGSPGGEPEVALMQVTLDGPDLEGLVLSGSRGGTVSGRVVTDGEPLPAKGVRVSLGQTLRAQPSPAVLGVFRPGMPNEVGPDGEFSAGNVFGRVRFRVDVPEGWMLAGISHGGRDVTDEQIELRSGGTLGGVEVLLTKAVTTLGGQVLDGKGAPVGDATVVVFAGAADKWFESSRWVRAARPDQQGKWQIKALPPGEYQVAALEYVEDGAWNDPEYLNGLRELATPVTVAAGASASLSLKRAVAKP